MALNIKDTETDRLARQLAAATGENITTAIRTAIQQRLERETARARVRPKSELLLELVRRGRARRVLDERPIDQILGYDGNGLPK